MALKYPAGTTFALFYILSLEIIIYYPYLFLYFKINPGADITLRSAKLVIVTIFPGCSVPPGKQDRALGWEYESRLTKPCPGKNI